MKAIQIIAFFVFICFVNKVLCLSKTAHLLVLSIFLFLIVGVFLFFLELEFLATAFVLVYIGGIAVIFIFLVIVLESKLEVAAPHFLDYS